ncbi:merR family transcriptional regulator [Planomonospora sphaerica]|uniref:MerR family transcriptional regulator n=1 Tax=Planomonospora sphaerica TaxID=161355 RepID=A0A161LNV4_9ACTN|nr:class I SAM-dependent methyltransferase [Planomonospora sphaerica]GAT69485.1 merR family transcriptional regulator [Planomonospora sphaerica]
MTASDDPYAVLGNGYARRRRPDPRIAAMIESALGPARSVLNVGAGAGSYEPSGRRVVAVEPSATMIAQRPPGSAPVVQGIAEALPVGDGAFDAATAILTVHHWTDLRAGLSELRRVSRRQAVLTWDPAVSSRFWLVEEYFPQIAERERDLVTLDAVRDELEQVGARVEVIPVPVPADCTDGFTGAYWRRPEAYLDTEVRAAMSPLALLDPPDVERGLGRLGADLAEGRWHDRHVGLLARDEFDLGYRLVVA